MVFDVHEAFPAAQQEVKRTLDSIMDAVQAKDVDRLESYHFYGPKFTKFDDFEPLGRLDAEACKAAEREGIESLDEADFSVHDLKVDVFGRVAVATFVLEQHMRSGNEEISADARSTMVFVRNDLAWEIAHEHFSAFKSNP